MIDVAASAMKVKPLMKATIKICDLFVSDGAMIIFCKHDHIFCCGDGEKENLLKKKLMKPNLNRVSHLRRGVIFYCLIRTSDLHHMKQGQNKVKFCHTKKMLM